MNRMAAKQHFGGEQRAVGRAHDQDFVSRRHCGLPYGLFVKSERVPALTGPFVSWLACYAARPIDAIGQRGAPKDG